VDRKPGLPPELWRPVVVAVLVGGAMWLALVGMMVWVVR
jgi:hypothetical protein